MSTPKGIELEVEVMDFEERYTHLPNALLRGELDPVLDLDFRGYTLRERCLLGALYGMKSKYRCSRERIDRLAPELGAAALDTVIRGLKKHGNLVTTRMNDPENSGKFIWRWQIYLKAPKPAGRTIPLPQGYGANDGGTGATIPLPAMDGSSMAGQSGSYKEEVLGTSRTTNLSLSDVDAEPPTAGVEPEEGEIPSEDQTQKADQPSTVDAMVDQGLAAFPNWGQADTRKAIKVELAVNKRPLHLVAAAWVLFLADPETETPNRFRYAQMHWWKTAYGLVEPAGAKRQPCSKGHPGGVEGNCGVCLSEVKAADGPAKVFVQAPKQRNARPPWCGECDQRSRMVDLRGDNPRPCPACSVRARASAGGS
jgi:hypothetical protein